MLWDGIRPDLQSQSFSIWLIQNGDLRPELGHIKLGHLRPCLWWSKEVIKAEVAFVFCFYLQLCRNVPNIYSGDQVVRGCLQLNPDVSVIEFWQIVDSQITSVLWPQTQERCFCLQNLMKIGEKVCSNFLQQSERALPQKLPLNLIGNCSFWDMTKPNRPQNTNLFRESNLLPTYRDIKERCCSYRNDSHTRYTLITFS